jgi:uncharacterized membrane protein
MIKIYYFSIILVVFASVLYNISQKSIDGSVNPFTSMIVTYTIALILSFIAIIFFPDKNIIGSFKELNWASYALGAAIFVLEIGYLLVYRSGWSINIAPLFANVVTTIVLIFFGVCVFKQQLSFTNVIGIIVSIIGLIIMKK